MVADGEENDLLAPHNVKDEVILRDELTNIVFGFQFVPKLLSQRLSFFRSNGPLKKGAPGERKAAEHGHDVLGEALEEAFERLGALSTQEGFDIRKVRGEILGKY